MRSSKRRFSVGLALVTSAAVLMPVVATAPAASAVTPAPVATILPVAKPAAVKPSRAQVQAAKARARHLRAVTIRAKLVAYAKTKLHHRGQYVAAASSEWRFDCSGFTKQIYKRVAHINLPHYSVAQWNVRRGHKVSRRALLPGDILVWGPGGSQHASMYIGRGKMIGANNPGSDVAINRIDDSYWGPRYAGAVRIIWG